MVLEERAGAVCGGGRVCGGLARQGGELGGFEEGRGGERSRRWRGVT